jgi:hypothetical protein
LATALGPLDSLLWRAKRQWHRLVPVIGGDVRRRTLLVALAGLAVIVAAVVVGMWPSRDRIAAARQITAGMYRSEVEALLGPPGDYTTGPGRPTSDDAEYLLDARAAFYKPSQYEPLWLSRATEWWLCDIGRIGVCFDRDNKVEVVILRPFTRYHQGPLEDLLWRAKRQWHRWFP